jgi:ATP-dependent RNA helicase DeaD
LANEFLTKPGFLSLSRDHVHVTDTAHLYYYLPAREKDRCLVRIIEIENPSSAIIFCNTKDMVRYVATVLQRFGYDADDLTADLSQRARERVLERVRKGELRFLVATDLAARGIDITELSHVIQYEPPQDPELYIHRAGRTGRVGHAGVAISMVTGLEEIELKRIAKRFEIELQQRPVPSPEDVAAVVSERVTALLEARLRARDNLKKERMQRFTQLARGLAENEESLSILTMLIDDYYQETLHAPPPAPPHEEQKPKSKRRRPSKRQGKTGGRSHSRGKGKR